MKLAAKFLALTPKRRALAFEQAAAGLAGQAVILEKDFWVSWLLGLLFAQPELASFLVFKGGTPFIRSLTAPFQRSSAAGNARWLHWSWSALFGRRPAFCTRSFIALRIPPHRTGMHGTIST